MGGVVGAAVFAMAVMSWQRAGEMHLPARFGGFGLSRGMPLDNVLPGLALIFAGIALLRRDGLTLLLAAGIGLLGAAWPAALAVTAWSSLDAVVLRMIGT